MPRLYSINKERKTVLEANRIPFGGQKYGNFVENENRWLLIGLLVN